MKIIEAKDMSEIPTAWMMIETACTEEEALEAYQRKYDKLPGTMYRLEQTTGTLLYMSVEM